VDFNPDDSIAETKLELALSRLKLANKKNTQKLLEEIASCEVKYGVPVSDGKNCTTYLPQRKEIWNCDHGNSNVQEE
jgi:hypothetical protein